jgi:hypothetical protein
MFNIFRKRQSTVRHVGKHDYNSAAAVLHMWRKERLGETHPNTLSAMNDPGLILL